MFIVLLCLDLASKLIHINYLAVCTLLISITENWVHLCHLQKWSYLKSQILMILPANFFFEWERSASLVPLCLSQSACFEYPSVLFESRLLALLIPFLKKQSKDKSNICFTSGKWRLVFFVCSVFLVAKQVSKYNVLRGLFGDILFIQKSGKVISDPNWRKQKKEE